MKKPVKELTNEEIQKRLDFGDKIRADCKKWNGSDLPEHLQKQYDELVIEQHRRQTCIHGEGI